MARATATAASSVHFGELSKIIIRGIAVYVVLFKDIDKLRESRSNPNAVLVFDALIALLEGFFDYHGKVMLFLGVLGFSKIHEHCNKRRLTVGCKQSQHLVLNSLNSAAYLVLKPYFRRRS